MKKALIGIIILTSLISANAQPSRPVPPGIIDLPALEARRVNLPNGWSLTPVGTSLPLGDLPLNIAVSRTGKYAAITNNGQSVQSIQLVDTKAGRQLDSVEIGTAWGGIAFTADEKSLYVSGGNDNWIIQYSIKNNKLVNSDTIRLGQPMLAKVSPTGIAIDDLRHLLYVVTKENNSLYVIDLRSRSIVRQLPLSSEGYTCLLSTDKKELYISEWGSKQVVVYNTSSNVITDSVAVGDHPNDMCLSSNGRYLYVANALDNSVSVIDVTKSRKVLETLNAALYPESRVGSTTNGVALSADDKTLYVADADNNCLAVFDVSKPGAAASLGFIPTGWYPTCVRVIGKQLFVANGKGFSSLPNPRGPNPVDVRQRVFLHQGDSVRNKKIREQYIGGGLLMGSLSMIPAPSDEQLRVYTQVVFRNTPYKKETELMNVGGEAGNPVPGKVGEASPIKHVFYIIKENRTYDQVLGDITEGNGDTSLVLFGEKITPNQHALAKEFVLLDNFYVDGEVSADGHQWSMGAYATDYMEKIWPSAYGHRGGNYITPTVLNRSYIWDQCAKAGVSYRTYGEFINKDKNGHDKPVIPALEGHYCPYFKNMDQHIFDTARAYKWMQEFDSLVAVNAVPGFQVVRFGNDHTEGTTPGRPTPYAHVADNDLAVGLFVEHLSKSPIWKESVVFVLEDDAQNGPDHVDAHRSPAYVCGGYVKRHFVDHTMYTTSSMLHTMELILGLQPMTQYDAAAVPMWRSFAKQADMAPFVAKPEGINLLDVNPRGGKLADLAKGLDFSHEDAQPDAVMNAMLWKAVKGENSVVPAPVRAAFVKSDVKGGDRDDD